MEWKDLSETIGKVAPMLGTLLAPATGGASLAIGALVSSALGVENTPEAINQELKNNPDALIKIKELEQKESASLRQHTLDMAKVDAQKLASVNDTIQSEYQQEDKYVKRWRPTLGYAVTLSWVITWVGMVYVMVFETEKAGVILTALSGTAFMWSIALSILGVAVHKRSQDKEVKAGFEPKSITNLFNGKK